jgi:hypothetical protein
LFLLWLFIPLTVLIVLTFGELLLMLVLSAVATLLMRSRMVGLSLALALRFGVVVLGIWLTYSLIFASYQIRLQWWQIVNTTGWPAYCYSYAFYDEFCPVRIEVLDTAQLTISSFIDNGFTLITDLSRLVASPLIRVRQTVIIILIVCAYWVLIRLLFALALRVAMRRRALKPIAEDDVAEISAIPTPLSLKL